MRKQIITNELRDAIYQHNLKAGWWDDNRPDGTTLALIHSEIAEAQEGHEKGIQDPHLPHYTNVLVEMADIAIRIYDLFGRKEWNIEKAVDSVYDVGAQPYIQRIEDTNFDRFYVLLHRHVSHALEGVRKNLSIQVGPDNNDTIETAPFELAQAMLMLYGSCSKWGWDLAEAIGDKRAYNANRADHKRENRAKQDGKKF